MAGDLVLLLDRRGLRVTVQSETLRIEQPGRPPQHAPLALLELVVVYGAPAVTCDVWRALAERHIPAVLLPLRGRGEGAWLGAGVSFGATIRRRQYRAHADSAIALLIARELIRLKLAQQQRIVAGLAGSPLRPAGTAELLQALHKHSAGLDQAGDTAALMGLEGAAAAAWYGWLAQHLESHWQFQGRNRRPPRDPVNAMLSLGYTLLGAEVLSAVQQDGFDPALGFLHAVWPGRESLALDLMEPLRPGVDALVLSLLDEWMLPEDFQREAGGCRLRKESRGKFFGAWARARRHWPLPLPAEVPLRLDELDWEQRDDGTDAVLSAEDNRLRTQCRRMTRWLRVQLLERAGEPAPDDSSRGEDDG